MKFITSLLAFFLFASAISYSQSNKARRITTNLNPLPIVTVTGDEPRNLNSIPYTGNIQADQMREPRTLLFTDSIISITDVYMGESSLYDLQSNAVTQQLQQWYKDTLHAVFMQNLVSGSTSTDRRTKYIYSVDHGTTWTQQGEVGTTVGIISGYAAIYLTADGRAVVGNHAVEVTAGQHPCIYHDLAPMVGVWSLCDAEGTAATTRVWLRFVVTSSGKVPFISAYNPSTPQDTVTWLNVLTNPTGCTFSGFVVKNDMDNAEQYSMEIAANGTIGIAYITNDFTPANGGDVHYITSTDEGVTWSTPTTIYDATPNPNDYMGALRGVDLVYTGNTPNVVFALVHETDAGNYYPTLNGRIMFWNPNVNSGNPVVLADSTLVPDRPIQGSNTINDVYVSISRPTIGKSRNESILYCTFSVARAETSPNADSTPYMDTYFAWSNNNGASWQEYKPLTNLSGPLRDCRYACLAPVNDNDNNFYYANLVYVSDSIPGSAVNGAAESLAKFRYIKVQMPSLIGVKNIGSEVPKNFVLNQNYPNPFNPSTKITFDLPMNEFVTLKVYDVTGREIAVLVNEKLTAGMKEYEFNAVNLPSGVYFYTIQAGDFKATRKMVLIK